MRVQFVLIIIFFILCFESCKKNEEDYYIQSSFKEWTLFNKGSYWIYSVDSSNTLDSMFINQDPETILYSPDGGGKHYEITSYSVSGFGEFIVSAGIDNSFFSMAGGITGSGDIVNYFTTAILSDHVSTTCWVIKRNDTLLVNNNIFLDVIHTRDTSSAHSNHKVPSTRDYYLARNVGLIKFSLKTDTINSTWSLVRWHVKQ
jgi:hypothetical protein